MRASDISFSPNGYRQLIEHMLDIGYLSILMKEAFEADGLAVILRHDVDFSVDYALQMARLEHEIGVRSTYFFMITSSYYNLFSEANRTALQEIASLGHEIGLHWDSSFLPKNGAWQSEFFKAQMHMLASVAGEPILSASQHIPTDTPAFDISPFVEINAYSKEINDHYRYVSDSSMVWREITPVDLAAEKINIQFLAHPVWWMADGETQDEKLRSLISQLHADTTDRTEDYLTYMHKVLADRDKYDSYFRESQKDM